METWQERMATLTSADALRPVMERLAMGEPVDEGEKKTDWEGLHPVMNRVAEDRPAIVEADPDAALWVAANPPPCIPEPYRSALIALAAHKSPVVRRALAEAMRDVESVPGEIEVRATPSRELSTAEFMAQFQNDVAEMMRYEGMTRKEAEIEFCWRYAEKQTGISRQRNGWQEVNKAMQVRLNKAQNAAYQRVYRNQ